MYEITVTIPNPPLGIQRHFSFADGFAAQSFVKWLENRGLSYSIKFIVSLGLSEAIAVVEHEQALAREGRVE